MSISTHVLDASRGSRRRACQCWLERGEALGGGGATDGDGRCLELTEGLSSTGSTACASRPAPGSPAEGVGDFYPDVASCSSTRRQRTTTCPSC